MTTSAHHRFAFHAVDNEAASARSIRRWAVVRVILGFLQMFGAVFTVALLFHGGITPAAISAVLVTGLFTGVSQLLFQVWKRGGKCNGQSAGDNHRTW